MGNPAAHLTLGGTIAVACLVGAVGWASATLVNLYRDSGATRQHTDDLRDVKAMRDREVDSLERRIASLEASCRH